MKVVLPRIVERLSQSPALAQFECSDVFASPGHVLHPNPPAAPAERVVREDRVACERELVGDRTTRIALVAEGSDLRGYGIRAGGDLLLAVALHPPVAVESDDPRQWAGLAARSQQEGLGVGPEPCAPAEKRAVHPVTGPSIQLLDLGDGRDRRHAENVRQYAGDVFWRAAAEWPAIQQGVQTVESRACREEQGDVSSTPPF